MDFLYENLPESDLNCYGEAIFQQFAEHALMLRRIVPWCKGLEQELFDHYVLFPRVNDEDLSFHRKLFFDALWPRIRELGSMEERILEVNRWCGQMANYQMQDARTASPLTVFRNGSGRCGEESAFLVAALRSVGIPARQVYAPRWAHCDDNHAWVEAWCDGSWRFLGACEPEPVLDRGWFNTPASRALLVHSRVFGKAHSPVHGEFLCQEGAVSWYNQTMRYALTRQYRFSVGTGTGPAVGAKVHIQVLNEASFHTIATLTADEQGRAQIEMGMGDFRILAVQGGLWAEADCREEETVLYLRPVQMKTTPWQTFDVRAPQSTNINESNLNAAQKRRRAAERAQCSIARADREQGFRRFAAEKPQWEDLLLVARGNAQTIAAFLEKDGDPNRETLLRTLTEKDLRDVTLEVLDDHLRYAPEQGEIPADVYRQYVLCPRIELEPLRPWRQKLSQLKLPQNPVALWAQLCRRVRVNASNNDSNLCRTPLESWRNGWCNEKDFLLLFVAVLRSFGVPARLRKLDGMPEYWDQGEFVAVYPEQKGILHLNCAEQYVCKRDYTLSMWNGERWKLLNLPQNNCEIQLPAERLYRLVTTQRMPNGNQYAAMRDLVIHGGETVCSDLYLRPFELADMLGSQELPAMKAVTLDGQEVAVVPEKPSLLLWLEEGAEPTEHLLLELMEQQRVLEALPVDVTFLIRGKESLQDAALTKVLSRWPGIRVLLDDWIFDLEQVARCLTCDPDAPPLAVACDGMGKAVFGASGYRVGLGALLTDIAQFLCG